MQISRQRLGVQVLHFVDQEKRPHAVGPRHLADLAEELGQVLLGIARVGDA